MVQNNSLQFWTAFVQEYFEPGAYMRVTLSGTGPANTGAQGSEARSLGLRILLLAADLLAPRQVGMQSCCDCLAEAPLEVLPRLFHIKYDSGLKEELLFMSDPQETETPSGITCKSMLKHASRIFSSWPFLQHSSIILCAGRHLLTSTLAVEESVFETLRIKRYGRLVVLLTPAMKIISYDFNMLGYDYSIPQPVILHELGALMHQFQQYQQESAQASSSDGPKPHEVMQIAMTTIANLGHGFEAEVTVACLYDSATCMLATL